MLKITKKLLILSLIPFSSFATEGCRDYVSDSKYSYFKEVCNEANELIEIRKYFKDSNKLYSTEFYIDSKKVKSENYASSGKTNTSIFSYTKDTVIKTAFVSDSVEVIKYKREILLTEDRIIKEWKYDKGELEYIDTFSRVGIRVITSRAIPKSQLIYNIEVDLNSKYKDVVTAFTIYNFNNDMIGRFVREFDGDVEKIIQSQNLSEDEKERRLEIYNNKDRTPVAVIDSGFDVSHPEITYKLYNSKYEEYRGEDTNGNGLAGDSFGWRYDNANSQGPNINAKILLGSFKPIPLSHGTHVASIALEGHENFGLVGFAGDVSSPEYLGQVDAGLKMRNIKFANMSWGFKKAGLPMTPKNKSYIALKNLISNSPDTLFIAAAGNTGWDLDSGKFYDYPSSYEYNNLLVVGALNTDDYSWDSVDNLIPAIFTHAGTNYGNKTVDVFSPGKKVNGAKLGGGFVRMSGTSMASPLVMNIAMKIENTFPHLNPLEVKELIMKSVTYLEKDLPCLSRGIANPKRAVHVATLLSEDENLSIEEAILISRTDRSYDLLGEIQKSNIAREEIWRNIDAHQLINTP
jgi:hypothetical protein